MNCIQIQIQPLNPQLGFNVKSIQRQIQPLNPQPGLKVNSIQKRIPTLTLKYDSTSIPFKG